MVDEYTKLPDDIDETVAILQLVNGMSEGKPFWAYMAMQPSGYEAYHAKVSAGESVDLTVYGEVLQSGWGEEPPEEIRQKMADEYDFDDGFEQMMLGLIEQADKE